MPDSVLQQAVESSCRARPAAMELWKHLVFADHGVIVASYYNSLTHNKFGSHVAYELSSFQSNGHW